MEPMVTGSSSSHDASSAKAAPPQTGAAHDAPVKPYSALDDIPGLPTAPPERLAGRVPHRPGVAAS